MECVSGGGADGGGVVAVEGGTRGDRRRMGRRMKITRRRKYVWTALAVYWPVLFVLTHIPILDVARKSGMSDKLMHVLAYMGLMMLVWWAVSPYQRVDWRRVKVWLILAVVVWYGVIDEVLQGYVGRSADAVDFVADVAGTLAGLVLLWALPFWPAALVVTAVFIFCVSDLSRLALLSRYVTLNTAFQFGGYVVFTLLWIHWRGRFVSGAGRGPAAGGSAMGPRSAGWWSAQGPVGWLMRAMALPVGLLVGVKLAAMALGHPVLWPDVAVAAVGIVLAVGLSGLAFGVVGGRGRVAAGRQAHTEPGAFGAVDQVSAGPDESPGGGGSTDGAGSPDRGGTVDPDESADGPSGGAGVESADDDGPLLPDRLRRSRE